MQTVRLLDMEHGFRQRVGDESHNDHLSEKDRLAVVGSGVLQPLHEKSTVSAIISFKMITAACCSAAAISLLIPIKYIKYMKAQAQDTKTHFNTYIKKKAPNN